MKFLIGPVNSTTLYIRQIEIKGVQWTKGFMKDLFDKIHIFFKD